ncbi:MAG TPA: GAF domain-containing protein, partial [Candidatus Udaeobacter sp.]|nr:GAF domain-containing protein [Candidatus Udaeobacter sp.]
MSDTPGGDPYPPELTTNDRDSEVNKELRRLNRALRALSACNQALARATSEQELLNQICEIIVRVGGYRMAGIAYAEQDEQKTVRPVAHAGYDSGYLETVGIRWSDTPPGRGPIGTAIRDNRICIFGDTAHDPRFATWREAALQRGYASIISLPLRVAGLPFGALAIYSEHVNSFEKSEV